MRKIVFSISSVLFLYTVFFILHTSTALAATIYFNPSSVNFTIGDIFTVNVLVDTEGQDINLAEIKINFPTDYLEVVSINKDNSIFTLWPEEPSFSNNNGTISFIGGVPNPGFNGSNGKIVSIIFKAKKTGTATLIITSGAIRANDGYGTNTFKNSNKAEFTLKTSLSKDEDIKQTIQQPTPKQNINQNQIYINLPTPIITSPTHPNQNAWYNNNSPIFTWRLPEEEISVKTGYSSNPNIKPYTKFLIPITKQELKNLKDGIYYFVLQFENDFASSPISRYKFQIDTTAPEIKEFYLMPQESLLNIRIIATDTLSGLDKISIYLDNSLYKKDTDIKDYYSTVITGITGQHILKIIIEDKAGNKTVKEETINLPPLIKSITERDTATYTVLLLIWFTLLIIIIILVKFIILEKGQLTDLEKQNLEKFKISTKEKLDQLLEESKEKIKMMDENPNFNEKEQNIYEKFKEIIKKTKDEIEKN
jgi:hypothetical protein